MQMCDARLWYTNQRHIPFTGEVDTQQSRSAAISNKSISRRHVRSTINEILVEFVKNWYCVFEMMMRYGRVCWADISTKVFCHFISFDSAHRCRHSLAHNWIAEMANTLFVHDLFKYKRVITHFITFAILSCFHSIHFVFDAATVVNIDAASVRVFIYLFSIHFHHLLCIIFASFVKIERADRIFGDSFFLFSQRAPCVAVRDAIRGM